MQAFATPLVSILHEDGALTFSRRATAGDAATYVARKESFSQLKRSRPGSVFEIGRHWEMIPAKLYRYEDRFTYFKERFPFVAQKAVSVLALPGLEAMGIYDRDENLPIDLYSGNHVAELFLQAAANLSALHPEHAIAFILKRQLWLVVCRSGQVVFCQCYPMVSGDDAVFRLATTFQHFELSPATMPVFAAGELSKEGQLYRQLSIYFQLEDIVAALQSDAPSPAIELLLTYQDFLQRPTSSQIQNA